MTRDDSRLGWCSFHLFYHDDRQRLLASLVAPAVTHFYRSQLVERFFFLRYGLGGPHLRLRFQCRSDQSQEIESTLRQRAVEFFECWPSAATIPAERIREENTAILAHAPLETDGRVYPDQHLERFEFHPEVERYGGPDLLEHSFGLFELSSIEALAMSVSGQDRSRPQQMSWTFRILLNQALGFSNTYEDVQRRIAYCHSFWPAMPSIDRAADRVFEKSEAQLRALFALELKNPSFPGLVSGGWRLANAIRDAETKVRERILQSQLHMTANRIGLTNQEELYMCRLLQRAATDQPATPTWTRLHAESKPMNRLRREALESLEAALPPTTPSPA